MARAAGEGGHALLLVHAKGGAHQAFVVKVVHVHQAIVAVEELTHVAAEVHHGAVLDGGDAHGSNVLHGQVEVTPVLAVIDVAVVLYLIHLIVLTRGVVHHHVVLREVGLGKLLVELLRGVGGGFHYLAFGVLLLPGELCRGLAHGEGQHAIDFSQHPGFCLLQIGGKSILVGSQSAQLEAVLAELEGYEVADARGVVGVVGLGHHVGRHQAVLVDEVGHAGELAAVADGVLEEPLHLLVVDGLLVGVDHGLQEEVALLQLVVEEEVGLRELEVGGQVVLADGLVAQHVHAGEHPAAATRLLVGDGLADDAVREVRVELGGVLIVHGQLGGALVHHDVAQGLVAGAAAEAFLHLLHHLGCDAAVVLRFCLFLFLCHRATTDEHGAEG